MVHKVLLDTHTLLWAVLAPEELSTLARALLSSRETLVYYSAVNAWEIGIKIRLGKLPEALPLFENFFATMGELGFLELPFTAKHGLEVGRLESEHRDPFDRALMAQSRLERLPLLSADTMLEGVPGVERVW